MEIKELPDFRNEWQVMHKDNNLELLEYVVAVANKFHSSFDGFDIYPSNDPMTFNNRYIESTLDLRGRYERKRSMGGFEDCSWEEYEKNYSDRGVLDTSFLDKYLDKQLQNTIMAYGLDVSKFWYLLLYVNDYVKDTCVNAHKEGNTPLLDEVNEMNEKLSEATEVVFKKDGKETFSTDRQATVDILKIAMQHFIHDYNNIIENPDENVSERLKEIGLDDVISNSYSWSLHESVTIDLSYRQYKFAEMMLYFLKDKKGITPPNVREKVYKEKNFFVSMLLYVVGLYSEDEETAKNKWYEPYYNDKTNRNLSLLVARYKNREFPHSVPQIYT